MKLSAIYKYQLAEHKNSVLIFYLVIVSILVAVFGINAITGLNGSQYGFSIKLGGIEAAPAVFLFVCGLTAFKENFQMALQNGISRKSLFINRIFVILTLAVGMSLLNLIILIVGQSMGSLSGIVQYSSVMEQIYGLGFTGHSNEILMLVESFFFYIFLFIVCFSIGYLIIVTFYRMNNKQKGRYIVGFYLIAFVILPITDTLLYKSGIIPVQLSDLLLRFLDNIMGVSAQNPYIAMVSFLIISIVINGLTWLLIRKVGIKN